MRFQRLCAAPHTILLRFVGPVTNDRRRDGASVG